MSKSKSKNKNKTKIRKRTKTPRKHTHRTSPSSYTGRQKHIGGQLRDTDGERYTLGGLIGTGANHSVYLITDKESTKQFAARISNKGTDSSDAGTKDADTKDADRIWTAYRENKRCLIDNEETF